MPETPALFSLRLKPDVKDRLDQAAEQDNRSTTGLIGVILTRWLAGELYRPDFNQTAIEARATDLKRRVGRPRQRPAVAYTADIEPLVCPILDANERVTIEEITAQAFPSGTAPNFEIRLRELLFKLGWREFQAEGGKIVWTRPELR